MELEQAFAERIRKAVKGIMMYGVSDDADRSSLFAPPVSSVEEMAAALTADAVRFIEETDLLPKKIRKAALSRAELVKWWPLESLHYQETIVSDSLKSCAYWEYKTEDRPAWPTEASAGDVERLLTRCRKSPEARWLAKQIKERGWSYINVGKARVRLGEAYEKAQMDAVEESTSREEVLAAVATIREDAAPLWEGLNDLRMEVVAMVLPPSDQWDIPGKLDYANKANTAFYVSAVACLAVVEEAIDEDRRTPSFKISGTAGNRDIFSMISAPGDAAEWQQGMTRTNAGAVRLTFAGRTVPIQMHLPLCEIETLNEVIMQAFIDEHREDALRAYLYLHDAAGEAGATGEFRVSIDQIIDSTVYGDRVRSKHLTRDDARKKITAAIDYLNDSAIKIERMVKRNGRPKTQWVKLGPLVTIEAGVDDGAPQDPDRVTEEVRGHLNRHLYKGAKKGTRVHCFTLVASQIHKLSKTDELHAATMFSFDFHKSAAPDGSIRRKASTLWRYLRLKSGEKRKTWPRAKLATEKTLDRLGTTLGYKWEVEANQSESEEMYTLTPPPWWGDQVLHSVSPAKRLITVATPKTGSELLKWRKNRKLSQGAIGKLIGVSAAAVGKREKAEKATKPLPTKWIESLSSSGL